MLQSNINDLLLFDGLILEANLPLYTPLNRYTYSSILFILGTVGLLFNRKHFLLALMSIELMYLGIVTNFVLYGTATGDSDSLVYSLLLLILVACESAIGLGILVVLDRFEHSVDLTVYERLHE